MSRQYQPYGAIAKPYGAATEKRLYTGKERDETGLDYFGARYYDYSLGRFLSIDPAGPDPQNPQSYNRYAYCRNNPYKYVDPDGMWGEPIHYGYTLNVGRNYFSERNAIALARACNSVDSLRGGKGYLPGIGDQSYHFNTAGKGKEFTKDDPRVKIANQQMDKAVALWRASEMVGYQKAEIDLQNQSMKELGIGLHALQDVSAHTDENTFDIAGVKWHGQRALFFLGAATNVSDNPKINKLGYSRMIDHTASYLDRFKQRIQ